MTKLTCDRCGLERRKVGVLNKQGEEIKLYSNCLEDFDYFMAGGTS